MTEEEIYTPVINDFRKVLGMPPVPSAKRPPAHILADYEDIIPGFRDRFNNMVIAQYEHIEYSRLTSQRHRRKMFWYRVGNCVMVAVPIIVYLILVKVK